MASDWLIAEAVLPNLHDLAVREVKIGRPKVANPPNAHLRIAVCRVAQRFGIPQGVFPKDVELMGHLPKLPAKARGVPAVNWTI